MNKKKNIKLIGIITFLFAIFCFNYVSADSLVLTSPNYAVYNASNLELLIGRNENEKISIASITKLMTAVVSIENIENINKTEIIDTSIYSDKLDPELSVAGIENGEELSYYDLIATMLIPSGADSAMYLACTVFNDYDTFIAKMNEKAKELKMDNTSFSNPTGLDDENNFSTLNDVAKLLQYVLKNDTLREIISLDKYTTSDTVITVNNTINSSMKRYGLNKEYILGGKTGTTEDAGICLASYSKDDDGTELIAVVTGASMYSSFPYNLSDTENLYKEVIEKYSVKDILTTDDVLLTLDTYCTKEDNVNIHPVKNISYYISELDKDKITVEYMGEKEITSRNKVGEKLGSANVYYGTELVDTVDVILNEELHFSIIKWVKAHKEITLACVLVAITIIFVIAMIVLKRRNRIQRIRKEYSDKIQ